MVVTRLLIQDTIEQRVLAVQEAKHSLFLGADGEEAAGTGRIVIKLVYVAYLIQCREVYLLLS